MATPLQSMLQIDVLPRDSRTVVESVLVLVGMMGAFAVRRRRRAVTATTFLLLSGSALIDAGARFIPNPLVGEKVAVAAFVLFLFGVIRLVLEFVDSITRRGKVHFSTISKDLLMLVLWFVVVMVVLYTDFGVQPLSILTTTTVFAAVLGFALQETLGNIFSGLSLSMGRPFEPGDWIRSGAHVGQVKGIAWRATTIVTRANERLEVPNSVIAKDVLFNYATGHVCDEITVGISYSVPPNHVREVVLTLLRDLPQVLRDPPPEVLAWNYSDFAIEYRIKYSIADYGALERVRDRVASSLWYALRRHSIEIPFPTRTVHVRDAGRDEDEKADAQFERELMTDLRHVDWLRGLSDEELRLLVPTVAVRQFGAGEMLVRIGEPGESMFIVRSGRAEVLGQTADGQVRHLAEIGAGVITGEMALMTGEPRNASVRAITDLEVIEMDREGFTRLFKEHPDAAASIGDIIAARNRDRLEKLSSGDTMDGKGGPHRWLLAKMRELFDF
ncbi:cyclic nucleotide-binding domain-containing protein [Candidatus Binatus sp.]|uniref:cyclic nucleotide-binding domain-containing protein n=1 Tax=Candidatus Binatus sp. TaxID=2811406 RepID=UPI003C9DAFBC